MLHHRLVSLCRAALFALVAVVTSTANVARGAPDKIYVWADEDATIHASKNLKDVPEPYVSIYRAQASPVVYGRGAATDAPATLEAERTRWRQKRAALMESLLQATLAWADLKNKDDALGANPVLALTPVVQAQREGGKKALEDAKKKYTSARKALLETFVNEARAAHVPASWLQ